MKSDSHISNDIAYNLKKVQMNFYKIEGRVTDVENKLWFLGEKQGGIN